MSVFFFNDTATTEIYTLSLHDALPIYDLVWSDGTPMTSADYKWTFDQAIKPENKYPYVSNLQEIQSYEAPNPRTRSEEHTSELQSRQYLVCRLLLEKKNNHSRIVLLTT